MLKLSKKSEYGLIALTHMLNQPAGDVTKARDIANCYNIPAEILAKILQTLARNGVIQSAQGARGGYFLAQGGGRISLADIIETLEGPLGLVDCVGERNSECVQLANCNISNPLAAIQEQLKRFLSGISLEDINNQAEIKKVRWLDSTTL